MTVLFQFKIMPQTSVAPSFLNVSKSCLLGTDFLITTFAISLLWPWSLDSFCPQRRADWPAGRPERAQRGPGPLCSMWAGPGQRALAWANDPSPTFVYCHILLSSPVWESHQTCKERHWLQWNGVKVAEGTQLPWKDNSSTKRLAVIHQTSFKKCWKSPICTNDSGA